MNTEKFALVTGAGSGIGKCIALALMGDGYSVALAGRRKEPLEATAQEGQASGMRTLVVPTDISDPGAVEHLFDQIRQHFGRLDLLLNNAGVFVQAASLEDLDYAQWQSSVAVNQTGAFLCTQGAFRLMKEQQPRGGRIINNGSVSAYAPRPNAVSYTVTKHAMTGLTKATAQVRHRLRPDRYRQRRQRHDGSHRQRFASGGWVDTSRTGHGHRACGPCRGVHGQPAAGCQCSVHDGHGDQDALYRTGLRHPA